MGSDPKEKCIVIDSSNWVCDNIDKTSINGASRLSSGMNNGVFYKIDKYQMYGIPGTAIGPFESNSYTCAR